MKRNGKRLYVFMMVSLLAIAVSLSACGSESAEYEWPAMEALRALSASDISSVEYFRATEDGVSQDTVTGAAKVEDIYLRLKDVEITGETDMDTLDDDLSIKVNAGDEMLAFSFAGDIVALDGGKRYQVDDLSSLKSYIDGLIA
jgi:hypothetical protein